MKEDFIKFAPKIIFGLIIIAAFGLPLFFLPTTSEFFEFNKFGALLAITVIGYLVWTGRMVLEDKTAFTRTPLDIPILVFVAVNFIAAISGIDQYISITGSSGALWPAFLPVATVAAFYFLAVSNLKTKKEAWAIIWALILGTAIASAVAVMSYFGLYLPFDFARTRSFNTVGVINNLALMQIIVIPLTLYFGVFENNKNSRILASVAALVISLSFVLINITALYISIAIVLIFLSYGLLKVKLDKSQRGTLAMLSVIIALFLVLRFVPQVAGGTLFMWILDKDTSLSQNQQIETPIEKTVPRNAAWEIAASALGKRPLFGTGPATYSFVYLQLKPRIINTTDNWTFRFNRSSSEISEIIATMGIVGLLAFLVLAVAILRYIWALAFKSKNKLIYLPLCAVVFGYLVSMLLTVSTTSTFGLFIIVLVLLAVFAKAHNEPLIWDVIIEVAALKSKFAWFPLGTNESDPIKTAKGTKGTKSQVMPYLILLIVVVAGALAIYFQIKAYRAEYFFRQSLLASRSNDGNRTVAFLQKALTINPNVDTYHRMLAQTSLNAAINLNARGNLSEQERQLLSQLAQVAIDQGKIASGYQILPLRVPGISAANVINWEVLSSAYQALIGSFGGADVHAVNTLSKAIELDPENPLLHDRLGQLYQRLNKLDLAQRKFEDSVIVRATYGPGRYRLAKILIEREGDVPRIVNELSLAKQLLETNDPAIEDIDKQLDIYNKKLKELQEKSIQNNQQQTTPPTASPSPSPSPTPTPSPSPSPSIFTKETPL